MTHLTEETLNLFLDQALAEPEALAAQAHLAACPACSASLADLSLVFSRLETLGDSQIDLDLGPRPCSG
ncbi:MAG: zf-HC2 domain-containing protein [Holophaga sp.]|nr:zf-HC2 domain-containing protein [Holophaga sp.]